MNKLTFRTSLLSLSTAVVLGMTGCSGGGDDAAAAVSGALDSTLSGTGIDGYLSQATVCLDLNLDGYCQVGDEPASYTDENGKFSLTLTVAQKDAYPKYTDAPLLIYSGYDVDTGADFVGKLKAPLGDGTGINVSPLSTVVKSVMDGNKTKEEAETLVKTMLGLPTTADLGADPVATAKTDPTLLKAALKLQKTVEVLATAKKNAGSTDSSNKLVDDLYKELATQAVANRNLAAAITQVVSDDTTLDSNATASATAISGQIDLIVGDSGLAQTAVIGTRIGAVQQQIKVAIENNQTVPSDADLNTTANSTFSLLHAKEILRIVDMEDVNTSENTSTLSQDVASVLVDDGNMTDTAFLPVDTEIKVLKANAKTFLVGANFEDYRNAGLEATKAKLEAEAVAAAEKAAYEAKIAALEAQILAASEAEKAALEAEKAAEEAAKIAAAEAEATAAAEVAAKAEADRLARLKAEADAAQLANLLTAEEVAKIEAEKVAALAAAAKAAEEAAAAKAAQELAEKKARITLIVNAVNLIESDIARMLQESIATKAQIEADVSYMTAVASKYSQAQAKSTEATTLAQTATTASDAAKTEADIVTAEKAKIATALTTADEAAAQTAKTKVLAAQSEFDQQFKIVKDNAELIAALRLEVKTIEIANKGTLEVSVDGLFAPTNVADVADAKYMFTQLRETAITFVDLENMETNSSTIVGSQIDTIQTKLQPEVENIVNGFESSATAMEQSLNSFGSSVEADFNTTMNSINNRIEALSMQADLLRNDENWSITADKDTFAHTYTNNSGVITEVDTFNDQSITIVGTKDENGDLIPSSISKSGTLTLLGTGYSLSATELSFNGTRVSMVASGSITGENGASMQLTKLELAVDANTSIQNINMFQNPEAAFEGTVTAGGRTLNGTLALHENATSTLTGSYSGLSDEPAFSGSVTLNGSLNSFINDAANNRESRVDAWNPLLMVNFSDKTQSLVTTMTQGNSIWNQTNQDENGNYIQYDTRTYNFETQSGTSVICDVNQSMNVVYNAQYGYYQGIDSNNTVTCSDGATLTPYYNYKDKITAKVNGEEKVIDNAWYDWNSYYDANTSNYVYTNTLKIYFENESQTYYDENGSLSLNGKPISITDIKVTANKNLLDRTFDVKFVGELTDGSKKIAATFGIDRGVESKIYAQNIEITDGTSFIKVDELSTVLQNDELLRQVDNAGNDNYYYYGDSKSQFENYYVEYSNTYYNSSESDLDLKKVLSVRVDNLQVSLVDADNDLLTVDANISIENRTTQSLYFDGAYAYKSTKFVGHADANGTVTELENGMSEVVGTANLFGSVEANGFTPFDITTTAIFTAGEGVNIYSLFTRNSSYEIGIRFVKEPDTIDTSKLNIADSNGVLGEYSQTPSSPFYLKVTNKDGASLADFDESVTGNNWEIKYSDNSSETIF
jgi:hypothetical protein